MRQKRTKGSPRPAAGNGERAVTPLVELTDEQLEQKIGEMFQGRKLRMKFTPSDLLAQLSLAECRQGIELSKRIIEENARQLAALRLIEKWLITRDGAPAAELGAGSDEGGVSIPESDDVHVIHDASPHSLHQAVVAALGDPIHREE